MEPREKRGNPLLGLVMQEIRKENRVTQAQIADATGSKIDTVRLYERGQSSPDILWMQRWADRVKPNPVQRNRLNEVWLGITTEPIWTQERLFLEELAKPSIIFGGFDLHTKLVPTSLWNESLEENIYFDDPEEDNRLGGKRIRLDWTDARLPENLLFQLFDEMKIEIEKYESLNARSDLSRKQYQDIKFVYGKITEERSNPYPRPVAIPEIIDTDYGRLFRILLGEGHYGIALVEEKKLALSSALEARTKHILHSLALRVAYLYKEKRTDEIYTMEFQQRKQGPNATWPLAWDCGGAGYFDPDMHLDVKYDPTRISPCNGAADEIAKELGVPIRTLGFRDRFGFFGLANDQPTGHVILIGYCRGGHVPAPDRPKTAYVNDYGRCRLTPKDIVDFIIEKRKWVPAALLTSILTLEAVGRYQREQIEEEFSRLVGQPIDLRPE
jgi:transcriptional regulator with XRE-family HTH domain